MVDGGEGTDLEAMPGWLGVAGGCQELVLTRNIPVWNIHWEDLDLIVDVAELAQPGDLLVDCPSTGTNVPIQITATGRYEIHLGNMTPAPDFMVRLVPANGLEMALDCVGIPSMVNGATPAAGQDKLPARPVIRSAYPNPFNPVTEVKFALPGAADTELAVYDLKGHQVAVVFKGRLEAGEHTETWRGLAADGSPVAAGTYVLRLTADRATATYKVTLVK